MLKLLTILIILIAMPALACPLLEHGNPKVGSIVSGDIGKLELEFTSEIFADKSSLSVTDINGKEYAIGKAYGKGNSIATKLATMPAGKYKVDYKLFCDCGELTPGDYNFTVE